MVSCESWIIKLVLIVFNFFWLAIGGLFIYLGAKVVKWNKDYNNVAELAELNLKEVSVVILVFGIVVVIISCLGFMGAFCESPVMLNIYGFLMLVVVGIEIYVLYLANQHNIDIEEKIELNILKAIRELNSNKDTAYLLEKFQYSFKCCGWNSSADYPTGEDLPGSCCGIDPSNQEGYLPAKCTHSEQVATQGCKELLHLGTVKHVFGNTFAICLFIIMLELCIVFAACCLARDIQSHKAAASSSRY